MMTPTMRRVVAALTLYVLSGCDSNPDGPKVPAFTPLNTASDDPAAAKVDSKPSKATRGPRSRKLQEITKFD